MREHNPTFPIIVADVAARSPTGQCDCACDCGYTEPTPLLSAQLATELPSVLSAAPEMLAFSLADGFRLALAPQQGCIAVMSPAAWRVWSAFAQPQAVETAITQMPGQSPQAVRNVIAQMVAMGFLQAEGTCLAAHCAHEPQTLIAWLHVANVCNLRCSYCYLEKTSEVMSDETGRQAIQAVFRSARAGSFRAIKLKYAGGEPTLNFPLVLSLHHQARSLAERHHLELDGVILSNGIGWTPQMIEDVKAHGIRVMLSLDGIGHAHDAQRRFINSRGTFAVVSRTVERLLARGVTPDISITVSDRNIDGLPDLMAWVLERDLPFSLNFYRQTECSASHHDLTFGERRIIAGMKTAYHVIEANLPRRSLMGSLLDRASLAGPHHHTCAAGRNYLVIDHHGQIAKCQMDIKNPVTDVHAADPLAAIRAKSLGFQNVDVDQKAGCRDCTWRYGCTGGCPLQTWHATGRSDVQSPHCSIYKALFPDVLRLEGLRLLKYAAT
jgi:uncharacterized protein